MENLMKTLSPVCMHLHEQVFELVWREEEGNILVFNFAIKKTYATIFEQVSKT